jgi:hypothetical protein
METFLPVDTRPNGRPRCRLASCLLLMLLGCSEEGSGRVQSIKRTSAPDKSHVAVVRDVLAENTTGSIPQLFLLPAGVKDPSQQWHVIDGTLHGTFAASWLATNQLLVEYKPGEGPCLIPAAITRDGVIISFRELR